MAAIQKYVRFYVQSRKKWVGQKPIPRAVVFSFSYQGKILCSLTGIRVLPSDWDHKKQRVKTTVKRSAEVNTYFDRLESNINDIYFGGLAAGDYIDNKYIINKLKNMTKKEEVKKVDMIVEWTKYLDLHKQKFSVNTIKSVSAIKDKFERYCKDRKIRPSFDDIKVPLLADYVEYLLGIGNTNNTIHTAIKKIRIFMSYADKMGMHENKQYKGYNLSEKVGRIKSLYWDEVKKLLDLKIDDAYDDDVRNIFVFGCLTALRHGDIAAIQKAAVIEQRFKGVDGVFHVLNFRQRKTDLIQGIPMLPEAYAIFKKYADRGGELVFPKIPQQVINRYMKRIGRDADITEQIPIDIYRGNKRETVYKDKCDIISTHLGRHTFISVAANRGLPIHLVAEIAGQNPKTTMRHYAAVFDREKFMKVMEGMKFDVEIKDSDAPTETENE